MFVIIILLLLIIFNSIEVIPPTEVRIIERFGKFKGVWESGIHFKIPFVDQLSPAISEKEQFKDIILPSVMTKDNVQIRINNKVNFQIVDVQKYYNEISFFQEKLVNSDKKILNSIINDMNLEDVLEQKQEINFELQKRLNRVITSMGVRINSISNISIELPNNMKNPINRIIDLLQWKINNMESEY